jgi:hypothetical protein
LTTDVRVVRVKREAVRMVLIGLIIAMVSSPDLEFLILKIG